jgi:hypothetical protein
MCDLQRLKKTQSTGRLVDIQSFPENGLLLIDYVLKKYVNIYSTRLVWHCDTVAIAWPSTMRKKATVAKKEKIYGSWDRYFKVASVRRLSNKYPVVFN